MNPLGKGGGEMEQKQLIVEEYKHSIDLVKLLLELSEEQWRMPIAEGKWSIAEVVGHLIPWDRFVLEQRLPYFFTPQTPPAGPDVEQVNRLASEKSRSKTKEELINSFADTRTKLVAVLLEIPNENWHQNIILQKKAMSLTDYFQGLLEHDHKHFTEIKEALKKCGDKKLLHLLKR